ncbi:MAG TPA: hypothetical protein VEY30_05305, partial [Myxococcaceae bacterium]|nr:hypothetical protein [Myxococcaceae bacterium]
LLEPGGLAIYSASVRPTNEIDPSLLRVGYGRIPPADWNTFLDGWQSRKTLAHERPLPSTSGQTISVYLLEP